MLDFGTNLYDTFQPQVLALFLMALIVGALIIAYKRTFAGLFAFVVIMSILGAIIVGPENIVAVGEKLVGVLIGA